MTPVRTEARGEAPDSPSDASALLEWLSSVLAAATPRDESHRVPEDGNAVRDIKDLQSGSVLLHLAHCLAAAADAGAANARSLKRLNSTAAFSTLRSSSASKSASIITAEREAFTQRSIPVPRVRAAKTNRVFAKMLAHGDMNDALEQLAALGIRHVGTTDRIIDGDAPNLLGVLQMTRTWFEVNRAMVMRGFVALGCVGFDSSDSGSVDLRAAPRAKRSARPPPRRDTPPIPSSAVVSTDSETGHPSATKKTDVTVISHVQLNSKSTSSNRAEKGSGNADLSSSTFTSYTAPTADEATIASTATFPRASGEPATPAQETSQLVEMQTDFNKEEEMQTDFNKEEEMQTDFNKEEEPQKNERPDEDPDEDDEKEQAEEENSSQSIHASTTDEDEDRSHHTQASLEKQAVLGKIDMFLAQSLALTHADIKLDGPEKRAKPRKKSWLGFRRTKSMGAIAIPSPSDSIPTTKPSPGDMSVRPSAALDSIPPVCSPADANVVDSPALSAKPRSVEEELVELGIPQPKAGFSKMRPGHRRDAAALELLTTEISYGIGLHMTTKIFLNRLRSSKVVTNVELRAIFSNIEVLCGISGQLERELRARIDAWDPETTKLGDIMIKFVPFMKGYQAYCANFDRANATVKDVLARNPKEIAAALDGAKRLTAGQDLESLLITPVQRVPRYVMLIKEVLKLTPESHPDFSSLSTALEKLQEVGQLVNTGMAKKDESAGFDKTLESVEGIKAYMLPHRKFVAEFLLAMTGQLAVVSSEEPAAAQSSSGAAAAADVVTVPTHVWVILFTDMIFLTSVVKAKKLSGAKRKLLHVLPMSLLWISASGFKDHSAPGPNPSVSCSLTMEDANGNVFIFRGQKDGISDGPKAEDRRRGTISRVRSTTANASMLQAASLASNFDGLVQFVDFLRSPSCAPDGTRALDRKSTRFGAIRFFDPARGRYEGEFVNARPHGAGVWWKADGSIYVGEIFNGKFNGTGKMIFALTDVPIIREEASGAEVLRLIDGDASAVASELGPGVGFYDGTWKDGNMEGAGVYCWDGNRYEGSFLSNKFHGLGIMKWANGDVDEIQWKAGLPSTADGCAQLSLNCQRITVPAPMIKSEKVSSASATSSQATSERGTSPSVPWYSN